MLGLTVPDKLLARLPPNGWRMASIGSDDALILPYRANPRRMEFLGTTGSSLWYWASEMTFKRGDTSSLGPVWTIYGVLDLTREGRGDTAAYPNLQYWHLGWRDGFDIVARGHDQIVAAAARSSWFCGNPVDPIGLQGPDGRHFKDGQPYLRK